MKFRILNMLFTYLDFPVGTVPNTNNALESLNSVIKTKLRNHRGYIFDP